MSPATAAQCRANLERAQWIRRQRVLWKRMVAGFPEPEALREAAALVAEPPEWALTWRLADVLAALPRVGAVTVRRRMYVWGCRDRLCLGSMSERQRRAVIDWARERAGARAA